MVVLDTLKSTFTTAVDSLSEVAQTFVEKNRTKAKLNRLRMVMKSESEMMNRAYIELGKEYYVLLKTGVQSPTEKQKKLLELIDGSKAKIARARDCYRRIIESQNELLFSSSEGESYDNSEVIDITVACSNENSYDSSPFDSEENPGEAPARESADEEASDKELF